MATGRGSASALLIDLVTPRPLAKKRSALCRDQHKRRNWLFAHTVGGALTSANLYPLIETCKGNSIDPYQYLVALFRALPVATSADDYEALLLWRLTAKTA